MNFADGINRLADIVSKTPTDSDTLGKLKQSLNFAKTEVSKAALWQQLHVPNNELIIIPDYTTGTANITLDSRTVSLAGASLSIAFKGRFFKSQNSRFSYEIIGVDVANNLLTLRSPVTEDSASGLTYVIHKQYYRVNDDILTVLPDKWRQINPIPFEVEGYDEYASDYSVGSITLAKDSTILTGIGTAFLDNVFPGQTITVNSQIYRVRRINSDTEILMVNHATESFTGSYLISADTPYKARISGISDYTTATRKTVLRYGYIRSLYNMVTDSDTTELPVGFDLCILDFAKGHFGRISNTAGFEKDLQIGELRLNKLKLDRDLIFRPYTVFASDIPYGLRGGRY